MISSSPSPRAARWSSSWTGMSCSIEPRIIRVGLMISSTPRWRKSSSFLGLLTRAIVRRHVEVVLGHLADDEVVLVVAGDRGHDVGPGAAGLAEVLALAAVVGDHDRADLVGDLVRPGAVLLHEDDLVAVLDELLGQVVADLPAADDEDEHRSALPGRAAPALVGAARRGCPAGRMGMRAVVPAAGRDRCSARRCVGRPRNPLDGVGEHRRPADRGDPELGVGGRPDRVVDLGQDPLDAELLGRDLGRHDVAVVALGEGQEDVGALGARPAEDVLVRPVAADGAAPELCRQAVEGPGREVEDDDLVAAGVVAPRRGPNRRGRSPRSRSSRFILGYRLAHDPHGARRVLQDIGDGPPDREVPAEPLPVGEAQDQQVGAALGRLVDERRADVAGLEEDGFEVDLRLLGDRLGGVEDPLDLLGAARRCRRRAAATSRSRRRGRRRARPRRAGPAPRRGGRCGSSPGPPASATTARRKAGVCDLGHRCGRAPRSWAGEAGPAGPGPIGGPSRRSRYHRACGSRGSRLPALRGPA